MNELVLMCVIAGRRAAIPALRVQSVIEIGEITPIPATPDFIRGLTALRSQALTVIDCPAALGLGVTAELAGKRAAVVDVDGHLYALVVDEAHDVCESRSEAVSVPGGFGHAWQAAALGMVETDDGPVVLVDVKALVAGPAARAA